LSRIAPSFTIDAPVEIRTHARARNMTLRVSRTRRAVIVTLPLGCDHDEAHSFIGRNIAWVRECLDEIPKRVPFRHGALLPFRGVPHRLVFTRSQTGVVVQRATNIDDVSRSERLTSDNELHIGGPVEDAPQRLLHWLYQEVWWDLSVSIVKHAQRLDVPVPCITIRDQSTCWASCSSVGPLSFSWRLILAPPFVLDYIAAHEVAHLVHMDHSPEFWALVDNMVPRMEEAKDWLDCEGLDLHRYGPAKRKSSYAQPRRLRRAG